MPSSIINHQPLTILSIETSCDETSAAMINGNRVISSVIWSQIKDHRQWGGVVPSIARRAHTERLPWVVNKAVHDSRLTIHRISAIAVTIGPGLAPALEAGIHYAKQLALLHKIPLIPVNHLEGHLASVFLRRKSGSPYLTNLPNFPNLPNFLSLIVSGGHTELVHSTRIKNFDIQHSSFSIHNSLLGQTLDDAAGECLDKVGRELGLGYPAGSVVEKLARLSSFPSPSSRASPPMADEPRDPAKRYQFPIPLQRSLRADLNFSFSGLKTAAIQMIHHTHNIEKSSRRETREFSKPELYDFCASFQEAVIDALLFKLKRAIQITGVKTVILTGGVAANNQLRRRAGILVRSLGGRLYPAPKQFTGDNAAMIGLAAQWALARGEVAKTEEEINAIDRQPNLNFLAE